MANFNPHRWYHLYTNENKTSAFLGTGLSGNRSGSTFFDEWNATARNQNWQFFLIKDTYYVLRSRAGGENAFLGTFYSKKEQTPGNTRPRMINGTLSDDSIYWKITPWRDGTFYLSNKANGTDYHLARKEDNLVAMDSNITLKSDGQRWSFEPGDNIEPGAFSTPSVSMGCEKCCVDSKQQANQYAVTRRSYDERCTRVYRRTRVCRRTRAIRWNANRYKSGYWGVNRRRSAYCASHTRHVFLAAEKTRSSLTGGEVNRSRLAWLCWRREI
jgi:hypothetical protein